MKNGVTDGSQFHPRVHINHVGVSDCWFFYGLVLSGVFVDNFVIEIVSVIPAQAVTFISNSQQVLYILAV